MNDRPPDGAQLAAWPDETMANLPVTAASRTAPMNACLMNTPSEAADYHMPCEQPHRANPRLCLNDDADGNPVASLGKVFHWSVAGFQRDTMGVGVGVRGTLRIAAKTEEFSIGACWPASCIERARFGAVMRRYVYGSIVACSLAGG